MSPLRSTVLPLCLIATVVQAQNGAAGRAADLVTEPLLRRHIGVIAHDSMMGRDTPSRGLELTATYVAGEFKRLGLEPGGDQGSFLQRYPIGRQKLDGARSRVRFRSGAMSVEVSFERDARYVFGTRSPDPVTGPAVLVGGSLDPESLGARSLEDRVVLLVGDFTRPTQPLNAALNALLGHRPRAIVLVSNRDSLRFGQLVTQQFGADVGVRFASEREPLVVEVHERAVSRVLGAAGVALGAVRGGTAPVVRDLPGLEVSVAATDVALQDESAPNTVGIVRGTDPVLRDEYIVFSAHMDHVGVHAGQGADSIWNGADDDASGTAGVLALAQAFREAPPKRSIIFLTVSGEEKGLWGSEWFVTHPPVPIGQIVADINLDMIGRNWKDTIVVIGKEHSDLGATLNRVNAAHPELHMTAIDDIWPQENFYGRSDHFNFASRGVPILFFFNGTHTDYHEPSDSPDKVDAEKEARIVRLIFHLGQEIGNAAERPKWKRESYEKIVRKR